MIENCADALKRDPTTVEGNSWCAEQRQTHSIRASGTFQHTGDLCSCDAPF